MSGMNIDKEFFTNKFELCAKSVVEDLLNLVVYGDRNKNFRDWMVEMGRCLSTLNQVRFKPYNKRESEEFYKECFTNILDADADVDHIRFMWLTIGRGHKYSPIGMTDENVKDFIKYYESFLNKYCGILAKDNDYGYTEFYDSLSLDYNEYRVAKEVEHQQPVQVRIL